jgi:hypothetical protein
MRLVRGDLRVTQDVLDNWDRFLTGQTRPVIKREPCPTCLSRGRLAVHALPDCQGYPVQFVRRKAQPWRWRDMPVSVLRQAIINRRELQP